MKILLIASLAVLSMSAFANECSSTGAGNLMYKIKCNDDADRSVTLSKIRVAHNGMFNLSLDAAPTVCDYIGMSYVSSEGDFHYFGKKLVVNVKIKGSNLEVVNTLKADQSLDEVTCRKEVISVEAPAPAPAVSNN